MGSGGKTGLGLPLYGDLNVFMGVLCGVNETVVSISSEPDDIIFDAFLLMTVYMLILWLPNLFYCPRIFTELSFASIGMGKPMKLIV